MRGHGILKSLEPLGVHGREKPAHARQHLPELDVDPAQLEHPGEQSLRVLLVDPGLSAAQPGGHHGFLAPGDGVRTPAPEDLQQAHLHQIAGENDPKGELGADETEE